MIFGNWTRHLLYKACDCKSKGTRQAEAAERDAGKPQEPMARTGMNQVLLDKAQLSLCDRGNW